MAANRGGVDGGYVGYGELGEASGIGKVRCPIVGL